MSIQQLERFCSSREARMLGSDTELSNEVLRSLLTDAFSHEELITLCFDRFPELYEDAKGWQYQNVIRELISYVKRRGRTGDLLDAVKQRNPEQYERYAAYLPKSFYFAGPGLARITVEIPNDSELIGDLLRNLASLLEVQGGIHCVRVEMGSLKLTIVLPAYAIDHLITLYEAGDKRLADLRIGSVGLLQPDLRGVILDRADLRNAQLGAADLRDASLNGAYLNGATLSEANLKNANLSNAKLVGADLHKANLVRADLTDADLSRADLREADLRETKLTGADLTETILKHAKLDEIDLNEGQLFWAKKSGASLKSNSQKSQARGSSSLIDHSSTRRTMFPPAVWSSFALILLLVGGVILLIYSTSSVWSLGLLLGVVVILVVFLMGILLSSAPPGQPTVVLASPREQSSEYSGCVVLVFFLLALGALIFLYLT